MWHDTKAKVVASRQLTEDDYLIQIECTDIAKKSKPGQFINVKCGEHLDPLLRRPISIHDVNTSQGTISLLFKAVGKGTKLLAAKQKGDTLELTGPLGKGFYIPTGEEVLLVGGGMGAAPLYYLAKSLIKAKNKVHIVLGVRDYNWKPVCDLFITDKWELGLASEDGSIGDKGLVTEVAKKTLEKDKCSHVYTCGPEPMMKAMTLLAEEYSVRRIQVSLERAMACGVGACLGCTCEKKSGEQVVFKRVCTDGPVFNGDEVNLNG